MLYTSEKTGKSYKTVDDLSKAEKCYDTAHASEIKKSEEKKARAQEISDAWKDVLEARKQAQDILKKADEKYDALKEAFIRDYGSYHLSYYNDGGKKEITVDDIIGDLLFPMSIFDSRMID